MRRNQFIRNSGGIFLGTALAPNLMANFNLSDKINIEEIGTGGRGK